MSAIELFKSLGRALWNAGRHLRGRKRKGLGKGSVKRAEQAKQAIMESRLIGRARPDAKVFLVGLTSRASQALGIGPLVLKKIPFTVGRRRYSRHSYAELTDLVIDDMEPFQVSRRHCQIFWSAIHECFLVRDSESKLGTFVNGVRIGGGTARELAVLSFGDNTIVLGGPDSPFRFTLRVQPPATFEEPRDLGEAALNGNGKGYKH